MRFTLTCGQCNRTWSFQGSHGDTRAALDEHRAEHHAKDEAAASNEREPGSDDE